MKKVAVTILIVVLVAVLINDVGRYAKARYDLSVIAQTVGDNLAMSSNKETSRDTNATMAAAYAATQGATVYLYDQDEQRAHVWVQMPVKNQWVWNRVAAWQAGEPSPYDAPLLVKTDYTTYWK